MAGWERSTYTAGAVRAYAERVVRVGPRRDDGFPAPAHPADVAYFTERQAAAERARRLEQL